MTILDSVADQNGIIKSASATLFLCISMDLHVDYSIKIESTITMSAALDRSNIERLAIEHYMYQGVRGGASGD